MCLQVDPTKRIKPAEALKHEFFHKSRLCPTLDINFDIKRKKMNFNIETFNVKQTLEKF